MHRQAANKQATNMIESKKKNIRLLATIANNKQQLANK
jgi:hypothetical protein